MGADIAVLYALDVDWQAFAAAAGGEVSGSPCGDRRLQRLTAGGHRITGVRMGSGGTETAVSAACVLSRGHFDLVVSMGPAGSLNNKWEAGTLLVIDRLFPWQTGGARVAALTLPASAAEAVAAERPAGPRWRLAGGLILPGAACASGELFINTSAQRQELATEADIVDMNTVGVETAAAAWKVPCLHLRVISDQADGNAREDFLKFTKTWNGQCGAAAWKVLAALKPDPAHPGSYEALRALLPEPSGVPAGKPAPAAPVHKSK